MVAANSSNLPFQNCLARLAHQLEQGVQIVDGDQGGGQHFFGDDQVAQVGAGESAAGVAGAGFVDRAWVVGMSRVHQVEPPGAGHGGLVAGQAGGQHAVEDIDPARTPLIRSSGEPTPIR